MLIEIGKLDAVRTAGMPDGVFAGIAPKVIAAWRARAAVEAPSHLRSHPEPLTLTLLAALIYERQQEITDTLADLLISTVHRVGARAERKVTQELVSEFRKVAGKETLLFRLAGAAIARRRPHQPMAFETIRKYLGYLYPVLTAWSGRAASLREITSDDIRHVLRQRPGQPAQDLASALRSLFRALKQERLIFRDHTRGISVASVVRLPVLIATDRLRGLIDRAGGPMAQLAVALVAVHGLGKLEVPRLLLADLDPPGGRLVVRRPLALHTVYLDDLTRALAIAWIRERHRRWPVTANPHVLVSQQTAR